MSLLTPSIDTPETRKAAHAAEAIVDYYEQRFGSVENEVQREVTRQVIYGLPPSDGIPDVRISYPRFEACKNVRRRRLSIRLLTAAGLRSLK